MTGFPNSFGSVDSADNELQDSEDAQECQDEFRQAVQQARLSGTRSVKGLARHSLGLQIADFFFPHDIIGKMVHFDSPYREQVL